MTTLDLLLIVVGILIVALSATQGLLRVLIMVISFYMVSIAAGMATLASDVVQDLARTVTGALGAAPPPLAMAKLFVFVGLGIPLYIGIYFLSRAAFADTTLPKLRGFDNVLGAFLGIVLAVLVMAVMCNTWGVAVKVNRPPTATWQAMRLAYYGSVLRPSMLQVIELYRGMLFMFRYVEYPVFFVPQY